MALEQDVVTVKVIGKRERTTGWIFKKQEYFVAIQFMSVQPKNNPTAEREVPFDRFCAVDVGDVIDVRMHSYDGHHWYFSREEAEYFSSRAAKKTA